MASDPNMQQRLREGIDAAKRGDKLTARRLLQQVLSSDRNNEMALMWMASVVDTPQERRTFLERVLQVNPNNARAREALRRLNITLGEPTRGVPPPPRTTPPPASGAYVPQQLEERERRFGGLGINWALVAAVVLLVVVAIVLVVNASTLLTPPTATPISFEAVLATNQALSNPSPTPTTDPRPMLTPTLPGIIVTFDPDAVSPLPPTFTPTFTLTPSRTPIPSATPFPLSDFEIIYSDFDPGAGAPSLFIGRADGTGEQRMAGSDEGGFREVAVSPDGERVAFVRDLDFSGENLPLPQVFVSSITSVNQARQLTNLNTSAINGLSWSPDGRLIAFAATIGDDSLTNIHAVDVETGDVRRLTTSTSIDTDPSFSPDGAFIVFASDRESPGLTEIYRMRANGTDVIRLTNDAGSSYSPVYSPDGSRIAFISTRRGDADVYVMDADGRRPFLVTIDDGDAEDRAVTWSPDGRWIVFASNRDGAAFHWYAIRPDGSEVVQITNVDRVPQSLSFRPR